MPASGEADASRPPPPPAPAPAPAFAPRTLERMNSAPGGAARGDGYKRANTLPAKKPSTIPEEKKEQPVQMVPVMPGSNAQELIEQRKRLTSIQHGADSTSMVSMKSTQSEPPKIAVSRSPDNRPKLDDPPIAKSKSAEDIARKAAEMRKKRASQKPDQKTYNYDLPPPPTVIPPPPPPDDLPPPPPVDVVAPPPPPDEPAPPPEPEKPAPSPEPEKVEPPKVVAPVAAPTPVVKVKPAPVVKEPVKEPEGDKEDNESYDSGFIQNGKHVSFISELEKKKVEDWEAADVAEWLCGLGLGEYKSIFIDNDIRGPNLLDLTKADLKELGVTKLGHRITLTKEINTRLSEGR